MKILIAIIVLSFGIIINLSVESGFGAIAIENNDRISGNQNSIDNNVISENGEAIFQSDAEKKMKLDLLIDDWIAWVKKVRDITQSVWGPYVNSDRFRKITSLNPIYIPFLIDRLNKEENSGYKSCFWFAMSKITKYRDKDKELQCFNKFGQPYHYFLKLWYDGKIYEDIIRRFNENYSLLQNSGNSKMMEKARSELKDCGIFALPCAIETMKDSGDQDGEMLMEYVNYWTDGGLTAYAKEQEKAFPSLSKPEKYEMAKQWWDKKKDSWLISPVKEKQP